MSKIDPIVSFNNGEDNFEKLIKKIVLIKLKKITMQNKETKEIMCSKDTNNCDLSKDSLGE